MSSLTISPESNSGYYDSHYTSRCIRYPSRPTLAKLDVQQSKIPIRRHHRRHKFWKWFTQNKSSKQIKDIVDQTSCSATLVSGTTVSRGKGVRYLLRTMRRRNSDPFKDVDPFKDSETLIEAPDYDLVAQSPDSFTFERVPDISNEFIFPSDTPQQPNQTSLESVQEEKGFEEKVQCDSQGEPQKRKSLICKSMNSLPRINLFSKLPEAASVKEQNNTLTKRYFSDEDGMAKLKKDLAAVPFDFSVSNYGSPSKTTRLLRNTFSRLSLKKAAKQECWNPYYASEMPGDSKETEQVFDDGEKKVFNPPQKTEKDEFDYVVQDLNNDFPDDIKISEW